MVSEETAWLNPALLDAVLLRSPERGDRALRQALLSFLEVLDSLDRLMAFAATAQPQADTASHHWRAALSAVHQQLLTAFAGQGVIFFACVGQAFDPARHEAIEVVERSDLPDNTVLEEINRGCTWRGQVLRCAQVVLARNPG